MLNTGSTFGTAVLRGVYLAVGAGGLAFLGAWAATDDLKAPLSAGGIAALTALGFRSGVEGVVDAHRDATGKVLSSDVGQPNK